MLLRKNEIQHHEIDKRTNMIMILIVILLSVLLFNYFYIQIINFSKNKERSINNTTKTVSIQQERGLIYDRNDNVIANNSVRLSISLIPEKIIGYRGNRDQRSNMIRFILEYINDETNIIIDVDGKLQEIMSNPSFKRTNIYSSNDYNEIALNVNKLSHLSGIEIDTEIVRNYPSSELFFHSVGYTSKPIKDELDNIRTDKDSITGRTGLERFYNDKLQGYLGVKRIMIGASGRVVKEEIKDRPIKGEDLKITIDKGIQELLHNEFNGVKGVALVLDVNNGDILGYYSAPSVNPNIFSKGSSQNEINKIINDSNSPLLDRAINSTYSPASTIKPFMAFGALVGDFIDPYKAVFSAATYKVGDQTFREWQSWGHGDIDMARSLARSSNYYYYDLGYQMGVDYMHDILSIFNFGEKTPIKEINTMRVGINPSNDWKMKNYGERFYKGEEVMISIGGGLISVSPMELVYATKLIANGGVKYELKMNYDQGKVLIKDLKLKDEWLDPVRKGLYDTVNTRDGTGRLIRQYTDIIVAGKTGTAQVFSSKGMEDYDPEDIDESLRNHSLFMGYAPYDNPEIAFIVIGENQGGGSGFASEVSGKIVDRYIGERLRNENTEGDHDE